MERQRLDAFELRDDVIAAYRAYVEGFIRIRDGRVRAEVERSFESGEPWPDPWVQINPTFRSDFDIDDLITRGVFDERTRSVFAGPDGQGWRFYAHQVEAFERAAAGRSYVMTTGTGSGKSLTYIGPIVDHVLRTKKGPADTGIRAVIVYPMNALANSQLEELGKFIPGGSLHDALDENEVIDPQRLSAAVTYARYTGQESLAEKKAIIERPPDILLTNYMMLELLLTRVHDRSLLADADRLRFVVLDELHTYRGRQGADVALLMRRLTHAAGRAKGADLHGSLQFVGTSATMASGGSPAEQRAAVAAVATKLFGAPVAPDDVIGETLVRVTRDEPAEPHDLTVALRADRTNFTDFTAFVADPLARWVETRIGLVPDSEGVQRRARPAQLRTVARDLSELTGVEEDRCLAAVRSIIANGDQLEVPGSGGRSAFPFRLHQFVSRGEEVFASLEAPDRRYITLHEQQFVPGDRDRSLFNLAFCRECGADYHPVERATDSKGRTRFLSREVGSRLNELDGELGYLFIGDPDSRWPRTEGSARFTDPLVLGRIPPDWIDEQAAVPSVIRGFRELLPEPLEIDGSGREGVGTEAVFVPRFRFCLVCGVEHGSNVKSDLAKLGRLGMSGRSTATTMLTISALRHLRGLGMPQQFPAKLLSFTDNVQDASLQSGHFNDFVQVGTIRGALYQALMAAGPDGISSSEVAERVLDQLGLGVEDYSALAPQYADLPQGEAARRTMLRLLRHRLFVDLSGGFRISQPNLENVGLLRLRYDGLERVAELDELWADAPPSGSRFVAASPEQRLRAMETLLDYLRRNLIIAHEAVDAAAHDALRAEVEGTLVAPWDFGVDQNSHLPEAGVAIARPRIKGGKHTEPRSWRFLTPKSAFGAWLSKRVFAGGAVTGEELEATLAHLVQVLVAGTYLRKVGDASDGAPMLGVNGLLIRWSAGDGQPVRDPLRVPNLPNVDAGDEVGVGNRFFRDFYAQVAAGLSGLQAHEHTAQITHEDRQARERRFRSGDLEVLFCSPTMELGIDISDLNVVGMRNVPPTPANYAQRSGRAGRSGQAALVLTYASSRSPHDQFYFRRADQMVAGAVAAPHLDLHNEDLIRSHVQAIWLAETGADLGRHMLENVLDMERNHRKDPVFELKKELRDRFADDLARSRALAVAAQVLGRVDGLTSAAWWQDDPTWIEMTMNDAAESFWAATERWRELYRAASVQADQMYDAARAAGISQKQKRIAEAAEREAKAQLNLLQSPEGGDNDFNTYRYFASEGFLPGYSFPRLPLTAFIGQRIRRDQTVPSISRPRFLALTEFGPNTFIYHNGARYQVTKVMLPIDADTVRDDGSRALTRKGRMCVACGHHYGGDDVDRFDRCVHCGQDLGDALMWPNLFRMTSVSTRKADNISSNEEERQRLGFDVRTGYTFARRRNGAIDATRAVVTAPDGGELMHLTYAPTATLTRLNLGWARRKEKANDGFPLDLSSGRWLHTKKMETDPETGEEVAVDDPHAAGTTVETVVPYVEDRRNSLIVRPSGLLPTADLELRASLIASLEAAFAVAVRERYQLEESELASVPLPTRTAEERDAFLLYEAAEGGAGVLRRLVEDEDAIARCAEVALERCHYVRDDAADRGWRDAGRAAGRSEDCEAACYDCLLSYGNQPDHADLDRKGKDGHGLLVSLIRLSTTRTAILEVADADRSPAAIAAEDGPAAVDRAEHLQALRNGCSADTERAFLDHLEASGHRLPTAGQRPILGERAMTDFIYHVVGAQSVAVFIDGHPHCDEAQAEKDRLITEDASDDGFRVLRFRACTEHHPDESSPEAWARLIAENLDVFGPAR